MVGQYDVVFLGTMKSFIFRLYLRILCPIPATIDLYIVGTLSTKLLPVQRLKLGFTSLARCKLLFCTKVSFFLVPWVRILDFHLRVKLNW